MEHQPLQELTDWARASLNQPILLDYILHKINTQTQNSLFMLVRQPNSLRPNAEIEIVYTTHRPLAYQVIFSALPFQTNIPRPELLRPAFSTQDEVIQWLKYGRNQFYPLH